MLWRRTEKTIREIGCELGADYVLENSIRGEHKHFRIICRLIRVQDQVPIRTECLTENQKTCSDCKPSSSIAQEFYTCFSSKLLPGVA
jgi:hypothetical protein